MYEELPEQLKRDGRFCLWKYEEKMDERQKCLIRLTETEQRVQTVIHFRISDL